MKTNYINKMFLPSLLTGLTLCLFSGCKDPAYDDLSGDRTVKGKVTIALLNSYKEPEVLKNKEIFIQYSEKGETDYLYSVKSDSNGNFTFNNLKQNEYVIFTSETRDNFKYYFSSKITPSINQTLNVILSIDSIKQNLIKIRTTDENNESLPKCKILMYTSKLIAEADTAFAGTGGILTDSSNTSGLLIKNNLNPGKYYLKSELKLKDKTLRTSTIYETSLSKSGISKIDVMLK